MGIHDTVCETSPSKQRKTETCASLNISYTGDVKCGENKEHKVRVMITLWETDANGIILYELQVFLKFIK